MKQAGFLKVYHKAKISINVEEGLLGICKDPDFETNNRIYVFYSPADTSVNRLSRFEFKNDTIDASSEKIILQFYSQREICCHTGGSIAFGPDELLYVSTGDNSTPFDEPKQRYVSRGLHHWMTGQVMNNMMRDVLPPIPMISGERSFASV